MKKCSSFITTFKKNLLWAWQFVQNLSNKVVDKKSPRYVCIMFCLVLNRSLPNCFHFVSTVFCNQVNNNNNGWLQVYEIPCFKQLYEWAQGSPQLVNNKTGSQYAKCTWVASIQLAQYTFFFSTILFNCRVLSTRLTMMTDQAWEMRED